MPDAISDPSTNSALPVPTHLRAAAALRGQCVIVLVGLMGVGKTTVGKALAAQLNMPFRDADSQIEEAAGLSISEIFAQHGEQEFRRGERRVLHRLLTAEAPHVLATGGGAFIDPDTRALIQSTAVSVWLKADIDSLVKRVSRKNTRPLLRQGDPKEILTRLCHERAAFYALADIHAESSNGAVTDTVKRVLDGIHTLAIAPDKGPSA
ncbi:MAG: shikimate kinase [Caulobacterales bacterium]